LLVWAKTPNFRHQTSYPLHTLSLYNLKGGVGKTASAVNFAYMAAKDGYRTLLWDLDPQGAASYYFKAEPEKGVSKKLFSGDLHLDDVIRDTAFDGLDIIPADLSARKLDLIIDGEGGSKKDLRKMLRDVDYAYDFVFIDCPPGFSLLADNIFTASDAVLMPVIPTTLSVRTYGMVKAYLKDKDMPEKLACFFTMVDMRKKMHEQVINELMEDRRFFEHYIPYLSDVEKMGMKQAPIGDFAKNSYAAVCYRALWEEMKEGLLE
jgi:chromosome partitioning protein